MADGATKPDGPGLDAAGVGVSAGTFWVVIATHLPANFPFRSWIILLAPWVSVGCSHGWGWVKQALRRYLRRRELEALIRRLEARQRSILTDPRASEEQRQEAAALLARLQRSRTEADLKRMETLLADE
jgi:hypothetical protein